MQTYSASFRYHLKAVQAAAAESSRSSRSCTRKSARKLPFNLWENLAQKSDPLCCALACFLVVLHGATSVERPKTDLRVNFERPRLTIRRDRIIYLLDLGRDAPCLLAQPPRRLLPIDLACLCVGLRSQCGAARRTKDAAGTRLTEQLPSSLIARPRTFDQPMGMSMAKQIRSGGRSRSHAGRSTTSTEVAFVGTSTLKAIQPPRHPSTPATNTLYRPLAHHATTRAGQRRKTVCHLTVPIFCRNSSLVSSDKCGKPAFPRSGPVAVNEVLLVMLQIVLMTDQEPEVLPAVGVDLQKINRLSGLPSQLPHCFQISRELVASDIPLDAGREPVIPFSFDPNKSPLAFDEAIR